MQSLFSEIPGIKTFATSYLEFFQLVLSIHCQGWIHGLILLDKVLESAMITVINDLNTESHLSSRKSKHAL